MVEGNISQGLFPINWLRKRSHESILGSPIFWFTCTSNYVAGRGLLSLVLALRNIIQDSRDVTNCTIHQHTCFVSHILLLVIALVDNAWTSKLSDGNREWLLMKMWNTSEKFGHSCGHPSNISHRFGTSHGPNNKTSIATLKVGQ